MKRILIFFLAFCSLTSIFFVGAAPFVPEEPVEKERWEEANFSTDHAFSIALVGDIQYLTRGDYYQGTKKAERLFSSLADTASERKLKHVFVLGDITDLGYHNDANLASSYYDPPVTAEWEIARDAIFQLNRKGISYSVCRGNHDDYMINDYFGVPAYTNQFIDCGGFYANPDVKYKKSREKDNPEGYIYWSAVTGKQENIIVNSYKTMTLAGQKYIFITMDYNPTSDILTWLDGLLSEYSDHSAILATHSFTNGKGALISSEQGDTKIPLGNTADKVWENVLKKHENLLMVVSGHKAATKPLYQYTLEGEKGNFVRQILVDPQGYDTKENADGTIKSGKQDTGMILYLNFSADGKSITLDYYSTLLDKEMVGMNETLWLNQRGKIYVSETKKPAVLTKKPTKATTMQEVTLGSTSSQNVFLPVVIFTGIFLLLAAAAVILVHRKKQKKK